MAGGVRRLVDRLLGRGGPADGARRGERARDLSGDRDVEWSFVAARIGRYAGPSSRVLDFGCGTGQLTLVAASLGARVLAVDLAEPSFAVAHPSVEFRRADLFTMDETGFDLVLCCSTIEHVGLAGRYGVVADDPDGDLAAMRKLRGMLAPGGHVLLTLPVGRDAAVRPLHRIYGAERLPRLLAGFRVVESHHFLKGADNRWAACSAHAAMAEPGGADYYALGLMVLSPEGTGP